MATARILSIDDSRTVLKLIEMICKPAGYEVHLAENGREGVERAIELKPDAILVDFIMPEMNGLQVCKALNDNPATREIPIILVSSKGDDIGDKVVENTGVNHYCTKPFQAEELLGILSEVLGGGKVARPDEEEGASKGVPSVSTSETATQATVLSIDDSPTILRLVEMILGPAGYTVHTAPDGSKGVAMAKEIHPDLVLVDFIMPEMNGFQVCKVLREDPVTRDIPIILVSSKGEAIGERFVNHLEIQHYLTKPFQPEQLVEEVRKAIGDGSARPAPVVEAAAHQLESTNDVDSQVNALHAHLQEELLAMEQRLISVFNQRLGEILQEVRACQGISTGS